MDMEVDRESEMNLSCKEPRVLLLHEFRLDRKATGSSKKHMQYDGRGHPLNSYSVTLVQSVYK